MLLPDVTLVSSLNGTRPKKILLMRLYFENLNLPMQVFFVFF